ncbi:hypothetical protein CPB84DRAFT_1853054 [Gymnopilus junonius]|uniref:Uncharacterized protein n=1 Tax=Gymnopilus junonius TaxID=109634 RepID=A0A9P5NC75_GYMJU|nr:hypothetical protein CPB84DRAFT_1853054 [Gymnopilus junonius]
MPNPDQALAEGDPLYTSWIDVFGDDISGNWSKSWNKHWNIYIIASIPEQFHGIKQVIESTHKKPAGVAWSVKTILTDIESQVKLACLGVTQNVHAEQTKNSIKAAYIQPWIDDLIDRARNMHKDHSEWSTGDIQAELLKWVKEHRDKL